MEKAKGNNIVEFPNDSTVLLNNKDTYTFDRVFVPNASQNDIYQYSIRETVDDLLNGYNGTVLAYGQTGSGKSYTMLGTAINDPEGRGIIPRISLDIFNRIHLSSLDIEYTVGVSYMEIHMEQIKDLIDVSNNSMGDQKFQIHEDKHNGIYVKGLSQAFVLSPEELNHILLEGLKVRASVLTNMNAESLRSHAIFQVKLGQKHLLLGIIKRSHLFLVDLAGSEKVDKTGAQGQTLEEAKKINSSLSSLGNVINALTDGKLTHIPYRDSKLTRILQESLGGNSRTSLIINCSPSSFNEAETLSTLRFGTRVKNVKNTAHINTELSATSLRQKLLQLERINDSNQTYIKLLELELSQWRSGERTESPFKSNSSKRYSDTSYLVNQQVTQRRSSLAMPRTASKEFQAREFQIKEHMSKLSTPSAGSNIPVNPSSSLSGTALVQAPIVVNNQEEIDRRDRKIAELENTLLSMKMSNLRQSHTEESKLFQLENSLNKLNLKLGDVEMINENLRKHLIISEKIIETRDVKINKLKSALKDQQLIISRETLGFRNKLGDIQSKLESLNKEKQDEIMKLARESLIRESIYSMDSRMGSSMFHFDNKTKDTLLDADKHRDITPDSKSCTFEHDEDTKVNENDTFDFENAKHLKRNAIIHDPRERKLNFSQRSLEFNSEQISQQHTTPETSNHNHRSERRSRKSITEPPKSAVPPSQPIGTLGSPLLANPEKRRSIKSVVSDGVFEDIDGHGDTSSDSRQSSIRKKLETELEELQLQYKQYKNSIHGSKDKQLPQNPKEASKSSPAVKPEILELAESGMEEGNDTEQEPGIENTKPQPTEHPIKDEVDEKDNHSNAISRKSEPTGRSFADSKRSMKGYRLSALDGKNHILNFHHEYLLIGEFLAESKRRNSLIDTLRNSIGDIDDLDNDTSETSGMFGPSSTDVPKGLNLKIAKPMRGGGKIIHNIFH